MSTTITTRPRDVQRPARRLQVEPPTTQSKGMPRYFWSPHAPLRKLGFQYTRVPANWQAFENDADLHHAAIREAERLNAEADAELAKGRGRNHARPNRHPQQDRERTDLFLRPAPPVATPTVAAPEETDLASQVAKRLRDDAAEIASLRQKLAEATKTADRATKRNRDLEAIVASIRVAAEKAGPP